MFIAILHITSNTDLNKALYLTPNKILIPLTLPGNLSWFEKQRSIYTIDVNKFIISNKCHEMKLILFFISICLIECFNVLTE
jgi:hypothetical protein